MSNELHKIRKRMKEAQVKLDEIKQIGRTLGVVRKRAMRGADLREEEIKMLVREAVAGVIFRESVYAGWIEDDQRLMESLPQSESTPIQPESSGPDVPPAGKEEDSGLNGAELREISEAASEMAEEDMAEEDITPHVGPEQKSNQLEALKKLLDE